MVVASVFDPAGRAVSEMRMTSPPMLLGRKLLKKFAIKYDPSSERTATGTRCASSNRCHRHVAAQTLTAKISSATDSQGTDARRAVSHKRPTSIREKSRSRRPTLTVSFAASRR